MKIVESRFDLETHRRCQMVDITSQVASAVREAGIRQGDAIVFCLHTTAGITINENADASVQHDILLTLEQLIPKDRAGYRHDEGNSDAHVKSSLVGCGTQVLVADGRLRLGTWQAIYFCEFDGPRRRQVLVQVRGQ